MAIKHIEFKHHSAIKCPECKRQLLNPGYHKQSVFCCGSYRRWYETKASPHQEGNAMKKLMTATQIRKYLGHGEGSRKVRVKRDGTVEYWGSCDPFDRSHDYWHFGGWVEEYTHDMYRNEMLWRR